MENNIVLDEERIKQIALEYEVPTSKVMKYLKNLIIYPFIVNGDEDIMYECLECLVMDQCNKKDESKICTRKKKEAIAEMIFRTYGEEAFYYLNDEFLKTHDVCFVFPNSEYLEERFAGNEAECNYQGIGSFCRSKTRRSPFNVE